MPKCSNCGRQVDIAAAFCPGCGKPEPGRFGGDELGCLIILFFSLFLLPAILVAWLFKGGSIVDAFGVALNSWQGWCGSALFWIGAFFLYKKHKPSFSFLPSFSAPVPTRLIPDDPQATHLDGHEVHLALVKNGRFDQVPTDPIGGLVERIARNFVGAISSWTVFHPLGQPANMFCVNVQVQKGNHVLVLVQFLIKLHDNRFNAVYGEADGKSVAINRIPSLMRDLAYLKN